jgi:hypothetical protein
MTQPWHPVRLVHNLPVIQSVMEGNENLLMLLKGTPSFLLKLNLGGCGPTFIGRCFYH